MFTIQQARRPSGSPPVPRGIAAKAAEWSAHHRKTVVIGWIAFVLMAATIGTMSGTRTATALENGVGESGRANQVLHDAGLTPPAAESVLVQSSASNAQLRTTVGDVLQSLASTGQVSDVVSPYSSGAITSDGRSALVTFAIAGDPETAKDRVGKVLDAVTTVLNPCRATRHQQERRIHSDAHASALPDQRSGSWN